VSAVEERLKAVHPDELTPMEALRLVYEIKGLL
jgi:DNA mismatch repair protein MutS